jgi:sarcosine oxidase subunit alpha
VNLTDGLAGVNVAGPRARDLLKKLTGVDVSNEAFPYMNSAEGLVAGIPAVLLRIGFVGETGWEIHFPAEYGEYLWDALMQAGKEFGIKPFGVEAQRVLRLDKKHVIVSQDTDALSDPFEADMSWIVKFEKDDFVGKAALTSIRKTGTKRMLVGFVMDSVTVHDGDQVYAPDGDKMIGVVTSSRFSPSVGKCVGLAIVSQGSVKDGGPLRVKNTGKMCDGKVTLKPFYDPEGKRLKS